MLTPDGVYVAVERSDTEVNFTCEFEASVVAMSIVVEVDKRQLSPSEQAMRQIENVTVDERTRVLSIVPLATNNNTILWCVVQTQSTLLYSKIARLWIQGTLDPPKDFKISTSTSRGNILRLSWTAPFTLDLTEEDPDILGYRVCFYFPKVLGLSDCNCKITPNEYFDFPKINLPSLTINVSAINIGGVGREWSDFSLLDGNAVTPGINFCAIESQIPSQNLGVVVGRNRTDMVIIIDPLSFSYSLIVMIQQVWHGQLSSLRMAVRPLCVRGLARTSS